MQTITRIGLDIAKSVFQVHGVNAEGHVVIRRQLKRRYVLTFFGKMPPCLVGIEACPSTGSWNGPQSTSARADGIAWRTDAICREIGASLRAEPPAFRRSK